MLGGTLLLLVMQGEGELGGGTGRVGLPEDGGLQLRGQRSVCCQPSR